MAKKEIASDNLTLLLFGLILLTIGVVCILIEGSMVVAQGFYLITLSPGIIAISVSRHELFGDLRPRQYLLIFGLFILLAGIANDLYANLGQPLLLVPGIIFVAAAFFVKSKSDVSGVSKDAVTNINMALSSLICILTALGYAIKGWFIIYPFPPMLAGIAMVPLLVFITKKLTRQGWKTTLGYSFVCFFATLIFILFLFNNIIFGI